MPVGARFGVLIIGAALLLGAIACALIPALRARTGRIAQGIAGLAGAAIIVVVLMVASPFSQLTSVPAGESTSGVEQSTAPASAASVTATPAPATTAPAESAPASPADALLSDIVASARSAFSECHPPTPPAVLPNGNSAERAQMIMAQTGVKEYDAATTAYTKCLGTEMDGLRSRFQGQASAQQMQSLESVRDRLNNAAVDADQAVADKFNQQIRAFNAKHKHS